MIVKDGTKGGTTNLGASQRLGLLRILRFMQVKEQSS